MSASRRWKQIWRRGPAILYITVVVFYALFPFYWMALTSLKASDQIFADPPTFFPQEIHLDAYRELLFEPNSDFRMFMRNSFVVATTTGVLASLFAALAAYAFSKFAFPGNNPLAFSLFLTQLFPHAVIIVPLFVIFRRLNLYDTFGALILANMVFALPVAIWLTIGFFDSIPNELMEAAQIDGCSRFSVLFRIILPISYTGIVATFMYIFIGVWSELLFAVTFTTKREVRVLPLALSDEIGQYTTDWNGLLAASTLTAVPVVVIFLLLQRFFVAGLTEGAMKG